MKMSAKNDNNSDNPLTSRRSDKDKKGNLLVYCNVSMTPVGKWRQTFHLYLDANNTDI